MLLGKVGYNHKVHHHQSSPVSPPYSRWLVGGSQPATGP